MADSVTLSAVAGIADQAQARLTGGTAFDDGGGGVGGSVIHDQQLGIADREWCPASAKITSRVEGRRRSSLYAGMTMESVNGPL